MLRTVVFDRRISITLLGVTLGGCATARNLVATTSPLVPPAGEPIRWSFDDSAVSSLPDAWELCETKGRGTPGQWLVHDDPSASSKPRVLRLKTNNTGGTFNLCVLRQPNTADVDVSVRIRADTGREDQGGGLVWRFRDPGNYYIARWNPLEANYALYKVVGGKRSLLTEVSAPDKAGIWAMVRVVQVADRIDCYLDDRRVIAVEDTSLTQPGRAGLWTKADASSAFDDFVLVASRDAE